MGGPLWLVFLTNLTTKFHLPYQLDQNKTDISCEYQIWESIDLTWSKSC